MNERPSSSVGWLVDGHAHLHDRFDLARFLAASAENIRVAARSLRAERGSAGCLLLMDIDGQEGFARLRGSQVPGWAIQTTDEAKSLLLRSPGELPLVIISGRQVATDEGLEVLAFPASERLPDGEPVDRTIERARSIGATVLLPWAVGKWTFSRGRQVERLLSDATEDHVLVGDNGNRPDWFPVPPLLRRAEELGIPVLPGSDPLPLPFQSRRAGRCGVFLPAVPDLRAPAAQLHELLSDLDEQPERFSRSEPFVRFFLSQLLMQLRRRPPERPQRASRKSSA